MDNNKEHRPWKDLTDIEKGELLLAHHEGRVVEVYDNGMWVIPMNMVWYDWNSYRIKPEPVVETRNIYANSGDDRFVGTITYKDGKPDCNSIKMEEL